MLYFDIFHNSGTIEHVSGDLGIIISSISCINGNSSDFSYLLDGEWKVHNAFLTLKEHPEILAMTIKIGNDAYSVKNIRECPRFIKQWWLEFAIDENRRWDGWINTLHTGKIEDIPETITGTFWSENDGTMVQLPSGKLCRNICGEFTLDNHAWTDDERLESGADGWVLGSAKKIYTGPSLAILGSLPIEKRCEYGNQYLSQFDPCDYWERLERRIEDCLVLEKTHIRTL